MDAFWIIIISFVIVVAVIIWWVYKKLSAKNEVEQASVQAPKHYVGEKVVVKSDFTNENVYSLTATDVKYTQLLNTYKTENYFIVIHFEWTNLWSCNLFLNGSMFTLKIGHSHYKISCYSVYLKTSLNFSDISAPGPGLSDKFDIVFEIPAASIDSEQILQICFEGKEVEFLLNKAPF